jgi:hypothetical protein
LQNSTNFMQHKATYIVVRLDNPSKLPLSIVVSWLILRDQTKGNVRLHIFCSTLFNFFIECLDISWMYCNCLPNTQIDWTVKTWILSTYVQYFYSETLPQKINWIYKNRQSCKSMCGTLFVLYINSESCNPSSIFFTWSICTKQNAPFNEKVRKKQIQSNWEKCTTRWNCQNMNHINLRTLIFFYQNFQKKNRFKLTIRYRYVYI